MEAEGWKNIWQVVFIVASILFYGTVLIVAVRGFGDVFDMLRRMITDRRNAT